MYRRPNFDTNTRVALVLFFRHNLEFREYPTDESDDNNKPDEHYQNNFPRNDPEDDIGSIGGSRGRNISAIDDSVRDITAKEESRIPFYLAEAQ